MIEQYKIEKATNNYVVSNYGVPNISCEQSVFDNAFEDFENGVKWAEGQISEDLMSIINLDGDEYTDGEILDKIYEYLDRDNND